MRYIGDKRARKLPDDAREDASRDDAVQGDRQVMAKEGNELIKVERN